MIQEKKEQIIYLATFVLLIFPRSFQQFFPAIHYILNVLKGLSVIVLLIIFIKKRCKLSKFSLYVFLYFGYLLLLTIINQESLVNFGKTYLLNFGIIILGELVIKQNNRDFYIEKISDIFLLMNLINLVCMIVCNITYGVYYFKDFYDTFFLDSDNRFILYILPPVLCYNFLHMKNNDKKSLYKLIVTFLVGVLSLFLTWSAAALVVISFICILNIVLFVIPKIKKEFQLNLKITMIIILGLNIGIVFFRMQNLLEYFIVDILHKSLTLSYRTYIWDIALEIFRSDPIRLLFGHGFLDTSDIFTFVASNAYGHEVIISPNHLHNLLINTLYFGGVLGSFLYFNFVHIIVKNIFNIKNNLKIKNIMIIIFAGLGLLLIFDTFELYAIYYLILYMLATFSEELEANKVVNRKKVRNG